MQAPAMATTLRSHIRPQQDETLSRIQRKTSSRIPTKPSSSSNTESKQSKTTQHVSRLARRASRISTPSEKTELGTKSTERAAAPMTSTHIPSAASKKASVAPVLPSEVVPTEVSSISKSRLNGVLPPPPHVITPSLASGSSASTFDSPRIASLRRKPSSIEKHAVSKRAEYSTTKEDRTTMHRREGELTQAFEDSVLGISLPQSKPYVHDSAYVATHPKYRFPEEYYSPVKPVTRDITPPVPYYAQSATPSTRYTDSPFSHVPTPSSASSYSSAGVSTIPTSTPRWRQPSPTHSRPSVAVRQTAKSDVNRLGLPSVRESSTSSSNSTIKPPERSAIPRKETPRKSATAPPPASRPSETQRSASRGDLTKEQPRQASTSSAKRSVQVPPELAHLNVDTPPKPSLNKALPPIRPSRDGTPTITEMSNFSPIIQSDLPLLYTSYHKRTPSQETPPATSPNVKTRFGFSPKGSSRQQSPRIDSAISPPPASRTFARGPAPDPVPAERPRLMRKDSPAIEPARNLSKSPRFGFFSRKPKSDVPKPVEKPKRQPSRGPVAGTGHEGYGRFGIRGRSGSTTSSTGFRSPSTDSSGSSIPKQPSTRRNGSLTSKDSHEMDEFLRERLSPVVLRGSGGSSVSNATSSVDDHAPSAPVSKTSSLDSYTQHSLLPPAMSRSSGTPPLKQPRQVSLAPSESSEDDFTARYPMLAARRSYTRLSQPFGNSPVRMPAPINTELPSKNSSLDSYDAEVSARPQTDTTMHTEDPFDGKEGLWVRSHQEPEVKPPRKWNFFQRAQASPRSRSKGKLPTANEVTGPVVQDASYQNVAHYAMIDQVEPVGLEEVERIMQECETSPEDSTSESNAPSKVVPYERRHNGLLPSPPKPEYSRDSDFKARPNLPRILVRNDSSTPELLRARPAVQQQGTQQLVNIHRSPTMTNSVAGMDSLPELSKARQAVQTPELTQRSLSTPENPSENSPQRQPRLSPIGRIPKVVSKRDRDRKLSDSSFSRPFARTQPRPTVKPPGSLYTQIRELASPIESGSQPVSSTSTRSDNISGEHKSSVNTDPPSVSTNRTSIDIYASPELFSFAPRKDSDVSYSSSSGYNSYIAARAAQPPQQEDIWNEYNDLLDEVLHDKTPLSAASSLGAPFQDSSMLYEPDYAPRPGPMSMIRPPPIILPPHPPARSQTAHPVLSVPQQIVRFMQPSMSPLTTPQALSDVYDHYGNRSTSTLVTPTQTSIPGPKRSSLAQSTRSSIPAPERQSHTQSTRSSNPGPNRSSIVQNSRSSLPSARGSMSSSRHSRGSGHSRSASLPEANARNSQSSLTPSARFNRDTQLLDIAEVEGDDQAAVANLRFGALMTSKWLSFGRVLFSPAHNEMRLADEPRILIVDGLGSDWSYYVALSYPAATVYNLGPAPANGTSSWPGVNQQPPPNHHHFNHTTISAAFPFPKGFFTAVVFRFPLVTTDDAYHACIFECKRVLRPGGYLEVAVLDLDLMNMGNKARKAVRGLKTRMQEKDQNVSLRNVSDVLVRLIGRRGFEEVQRCIVGVPAAGRIPRSQDISSVSSGASGKPIWPREDRGSQEFSFADLLEDARASQYGPGKNNDESITKMVAKVGRWWYSTCYEKSLLQSANGASIWNDATLLRECERQGTSFRLLICHAQKPTQTRRRTISV